MKSGRTQVISWVLYVLKKSCWNLRRKEVVPFTCMHAFKQPCLPTSLHCSPQRWVLFRHLVIKWPSLSLFHKNLTASYAQMCSWMTSSEHRSPWDERLYMGEYCGCTHNMLQSLSSQYSQAWLHIWLVWQLWGSSCKRLLTQRRWQEAHLTLQSWTLAFKSIVAASKALRSSSILAWPVWKRDRFELIHSRTCSMRRSARRLRCMERFDVHSVSGTSWRQWASLQVSRKMDSACSHVASCIPAPTKKNWELVSGLSTQISVSKFFPCPSGQSSEL